jgi:hypothetical protein
MAGDTIELFTMLRLAFASVNAAGFHEVVVPAIGGIVALRKSVAATFAAELCAQVGMGIALSLANPHMLVLVRCRPCTACPLSTSGSTSDGCLDAKLPAQRLNVLHVVLLCRTLS